MRRPLLELRHGCIKVCVWRARSAAAKPTVSVVRLYRNGDHWKQSTRFGPDDLPLVRLLLDEAYEWVLTRKDPNC